MNLPINPPELPTVSNLPSSLKHPEPGNRTCGDPGNWQPSARLSQPTGTMEEENLNDYIPCYKGK